MARKRRGRDEGSIFQRADGQWVATVSLGYDGNGKRRRRTVYGGSKKEVQDKLGRLKNDPLAGLALEPERLRLSEYLDQWLENVVKPNKTGNTYASYEGVIRNHVNPRIGGTLLARLTGDHIAGLYAAMARDGASDRMRQLAHAVLHRALQAAVKSRPPKIPFNPCDYIDKPHLPKDKTHRVEPYTAEQVRVLLQAAEGERLEALFVLAVLTGLRQGELFALAWTDIDLEAGTLAVRHNLEEIDGKLALKSPKSGKQRRVELPPPAVEALQRHRARMFAEGHLDGPVFCDTHGGHLRKSNFIRKVYKPLLAKAGLPDRRFHDLRHTSATLLLSLGVHPKVVQERLGHATIQITMDTYSHASPTLQREAADKLGNLFSPRDKQVG